MQEHTPGPCGCGAPAENYTTPEDNPIVAKCPACGFRLPELFFREWAEDHANA